MPSKDVRNLLKDLEAQGWRVEGTSKGHYVAYAPDGRGRVVIPGTPSDRRSLRNTLAALRRPDSKAERMAEHTVHVEAHGGLHPDDEALAGLYEELVGRAELLGPAVSADAGAGSVGLSVSVEAPSEPEARALAGAALGEALVALGLAEGWVGAQAGRPVIA